MLPNACYQIFFIQYNCEVGVIHYDCGVELTHDGQYGREEYLEHAERGTYTLHSLYFLLWANFGCFCMALITQPNYAERLHGNIISEWQPLRQYCFGQLKTMWANILSSMNISEEQRSFFIMRAMTRLHKVLACP